MTARLDDLFRVVMDVEVLGRKMYVRALSDFDVQARDEYALRASARARRSLSDSTSEDAQARLGWLDTATDEQLQKAVGYLIEAVDQPELTRQVIRDIEPRMIPFPDGADDDEKADVLKQREDEIKRVEKERLAFIEQGLKERKAKTATMTREQMIAFARQKQIELQARLESVRAFDSYTIYASCFLDENCHIRFCATPEIAGDLQIEVRSLMVGKYLEVDSVNPLELKYFLSTGASRDGSKPANGSAPASSEAPEKLPGGLPT